MGNSIKLSLVLLASLVVHSMTLQAHKDTSSVRNTLISAGEVAPDFTLDDQHGSKVTLSASVGKSPVVLVFYRGYW